MTAAGRLLAEEGPALLELAEATFGAVQAVERAPAGRIDVGMSPAGRYGIGPALLAACARHAPGVMLYPREDTTGALLRELRAGRLDVVVGFCTPPDDALERERVRNAAAIVHLRADHSLAARPVIALDDLRDEPILIAGGRDSPGYTATVLDLCRAAGFEPRTVPDPYPDLGLQAVREGLGVVVYAPDAFPPMLDDTVLVALDPPELLPFDLLWRRGRRSRALDAVLDAMRAPRDERRWLDG